MSIVPRLFELYRQRGFTVVSGLNPTHWRGLNSAPFTWLMRDGRSYTNGLGIALQEVFFLESLFSHYHPRRLFVIGNSFGWSAVTLALLNPAAEIVAIDAGFDEYASDGLDLTNAIARAAGLKLTAVKGVSPQDVAGTLARSFDQPVDFAFIDGYHSNEQIVLDFRAIRPHASPDAVYLFHDAHEFDLYEGLARIEAESGLELRRLLATPSGMAVAYPAALAATLAPTLDVFAPDAAALAMISRATWRHAHPTRAKYTRSALKRLNTIRGWIGKPPLPLP